MTLSANQRVVIVGASLAGMRGAEGLRDAGFEGPIELIGDEAVGPYDRPPLSKQVLMGMAPASATRLPRLRDLGDVSWSLGTAAEALDPAERCVRLADGRSVEYDRLLIATGVRNRPWFNAEEAALEGVVSLRTAADAARLRSLLAESPDRVVVIGGGFTGSEIASVCRALGVPVSLIERGPSPLSGAMGGVFGAIAADVQREAGVDLHTEVEVDRIDSDGAGRATGVVLSDGSVIESRIVVVALGAMRNVEWLEGSGLAAGPAGVTTDAGCRVVNLDGLVTEEIFAAGDVARFPHPLFGYEFLSLEHWENAVTMAGIAAHNMVVDSNHRVAHLSIPAFWSIQFGLNIKSVGVPSMGDEILFTEGSVEQRSFAAAYGRDGRLVGAVTVDQARSLDFYRSELEHAGGLPLELRAVDGPTPDGPIDAGYRHPTKPYHAPTVVASGHEPWGTHVRRVPDRSSK